MRRIMIPLTENTIGGERGESGRQLHCLASLSANRTYAVELL